MTNLPILGLSRFSVFLLGKSGVYSSGSGAGQAPEGLGAVLLFSLLGAFFGLLGGIMFAHVLRYIYFLLGRNPGGYVWAVYGALIGAVAFAWMAITQDER